jgi:hypothetical protein
VGPKDHNALTGIGYGLVKVVPSVSGSPDRRPLHEAVAVGAQPRRQLRLSIIVLTS